MLFNSEIFIFVFLPIAWTVYFYLNAKRLTTVGNVWLVFASLFFYAWWHFAYVFLIFGSLIFNYSLGKQLQANTAHRKLFLWLGIGSNLFLLGYYKYADFLITNVNFLLNEPISLLNLALPLAISFYTFQQIAYLVDCYRGSIKQTNFLEYAVFVTFFPQLIAGPIVHHKEMMPQFSMVKNKVIRRSYIVTGLLIFSLGLFKKVVIADTFAIWANYGFDEAVVLTTLEAWVTSLSYSFQLYFDFSGYTDMAIGLALLFNIRLPFNFNSPYQALTLQDFWRRWHMTLSRFLRDYIYIPLGGNRNGEGRTYVNILLAFTIGGIWHGAGWLFLLWGVLHGIGLVVFQLWHRYGVTLPSLLAWFVTFNFVNITWIFFRAKDLDAVWKVLDGMFSWQSSAYNIVSLCCVLLAFAIIFLKNTNVILSVTMGRNASLALAIFSSFVFFIAMTVLALRQSSEFLYFQF